MLYSMVRLCFSLHLPAVLLLVHALQSNAVPTKPGTHNSLGLFNSSINAPILPQCYIPGSPTTPGIQPVNLRACKDALYVLVRQPHFTQRWRFSRNPRAQARKLPLGWQLGTGAECRIVVSCHNEHDSAIFRLADVAQLARQIIDRCVDKPDPHGRVPVFKWGGVTTLTDELTFYVAVARPNEVPLGSDGANGTVVTGWGSVDGGIEIL